MYFANIELSAKEMEFVVIKFVLKLNIVNPKSILVGDKQTDNYNLLMKRERVLSK